MNRTQLKSILILLSAVALVASVDAKPDTYTADVAHSSVEFHVTHFFSKVAGHFNKFEATLTVDKDAMESSSVKAEIDITSVDTSQPKRDAHLQGADFFDAAKFPKMTFQSKSWKKTADNEYEVAGDLTLHGVTKPVTLTVKSLGFGEGMKGVQLSGWSATTKIKRSEFGMTGSIPMVGDEVEISINVEAHKQ